LCDVISAVTELMVRGLQLTRALRMYDVPVVEAQHTCDPTDSTPLGCAFHGGLLLYIVAFRHTCDVISVAAEFMVSVAWVDADIRVIQ
jgi:hypothetical protein